MNDTVTTEQHRIGLALRELRTLRRFTQKEVAELAGTTRTTVTKIERGEYNVSIELLSRITAVLGGTVEIVSIH